MDSAEKWSVIVFLEWPEALELEVSGKSLVLSPLAIYQGNLKT